MNENATWKWCETSSVTTWLAACAIALTLTAGNAFGYELTTHGLITEHAYRWSMLHPDHPESIAPVLQFERLDEDHPFAFLAAPQAVLYRDETATAGPADAIPPHPAVFARSSQEMERKVLSSFEINQ